MSNEVGKVSVRVIPDTRGFAFKAKQELKKLKDLTLKIKVELDDKKLKSQVNALVAETNAELMRPEKRIKFRASLEASERQLQSEVRDIRNRMQTLADQEKVKLEAELSKSSSRKNGGSDILGLDPKKAVKALERELRGHRYELPVYADTSKARADIRRMARSDKLKIDVDLNVDRKAIHKDVESIRELIGNTAKALGQTRALKFAVNVDKASVKKWGDEVRKVEASLEKQQKAYRNTQRELKIVTDRAADYGKAVSDATKRIAKIKAEEVADLDRERKLTKELADIRATMARSSGDITEEVLREKRIVGQISNLRADAFDRSAKRADAEAKAVAEIRDASREITRLKKERARLARDEIQNYGKIQSLMVDEKRLQKQLDRARNKLEMDAIELDVNLDQTSVEAVSARLIQLSRDRVATIWVNMQRANLARMERQWGLISEHTSNLAVNTAKWMGQLTGVRVLWRTFRDMVEILPKLDMMVPQLAQNLALIAAGTGGAIGGLGLMFTLLSDIGEVGKLILGLPAVMLGVVGSALIVGRAIKDFSTVFPEIIDYYKQLGNVVSSRVWKQAAGPIRELHKATKPLLDANIPTWATSWGDSMASLVKGIGSANGLGSLEIFLKNSILGTKRAQKGWESLGSAIMSLVGGGSDVFPDLGTWFSETMADFEVWAKKNQSQIGRWLREGGMALRELGSIGVSTVKIIAGLADAFEAAGWPGLTELERGMKSLGESALELKENAEFMFALEEVHGFFETLGTMAGDSFEEAINKSWIMIGKTMARMAGPIGGALDAIFDGFNSDKFQDGFTTFVDGLSSLIEDITPGLEAMTAEIGSLLGAVGTAGESWGPAFNDMLLLFSSAGDKLHPGLIDFIENTGPQLQELVQDITPHVEDFAEAISDLLGNEGFQEFIGDIIGAFGDAAGAALDLGTAIAGLLEDFSDWYASLDDGAQDTVVWAGILTAALGGVALALGKFAWTIAISPIGPVLARALAKALPAGGFMIALKKAMRAFLKGAGVVGIALWIGEVLSPLVVSEIATDVVKALGLDGTFLGRFTTEIEENIREAFGGKSLMGIAWDAFKDALGHFGKGEWGEGLKDLFVSLFPGFSIVTEIVDALWEALGVPASVVDEAHAKIKALWEEQGISGLASMVWEEFLKSLEMLWDDLTGLFTDYEILSPFEFMGWLWGKVKDWLGFGKAKTMTPTDEGAKELQEMMGPDSAWVKEWGTKAREAISDGWDAFVDFIKEWNPITLAWNFGTWIGENLAKWLGLNEGGGVDTGSFSFDFDFSSLWEEKIKPALIAGLVGLVALITAPGLVLIAPLALPALIIGWLLGRDGNGDWSWGELTSKISGAWEGIKGAIGEGLAAIGGFIAGAVFAPVLLPATIAKWILGEDWVETTSAALTAAIGAGAPTLGAAISDALKGVEGAARAGAGLGAGGGVGIVTKLLGADPAGQGEIRGGFGIIGEMIRLWTGGVTSDYGQMSTTVQLSSGGMRTGVIEDYRVTAEEGGAQARRLAAEAKTAHENAKSAALAASAAARTGVVSEYGSMATEAGSKLGGLKTSASSSFSAISSDSKSKSSGMRSGVVGEFQKMQTLSAARMVELQVKSVSAMSQANSRVVAQGRAMGAAYVLQMASMMSRSITIAGQIRNGLLRVLNINASGPGRHTGNTFVSGLASGLSRAAGVARSFAGSIRSALSFSAYSSGAAVGGTFASGLRARVGAVSAAARALAAAARTKMPNSPAEEGPFSGSGWGGWGESIAEEMARGLRKAAPEVAREAERLMGGVHSAMDARANPVSIDFARTRRRSGLVGDSPAESAGTTVNVNVESRSEDPLQDGNRFGGDIAFALRGAGLA